MAIKQISVFLENKPGRLERMTEVLSKANVDIRALSLAETKDFGIVRMIVDNVPGTVNILRDNDYIASMTPVIAVQIPDVVGGLNKVLSVLTAAGINLEYMYASLAGKASDKAYMILRLENIPRAEEALRDNGFILAEQDTMYDM